MITQQDADAYIQKGKFGLRVGEKLSQSRLEKVMSQVWMLKAGRAFSPC